MDSDYDTDDACSVVSTIYPDDSVSQRGGDTRPGTPRSIVSFHSSVDGFLFKEIYGRAFNSMSDIYSLPGDEPEHRRLDLQHHLLMLHVGGLYVKADLVERVLRAGQTPLPAVLDMGTGSGRWAIDMAKRFPHAEIVGIDLVPPITDTNEIPANCRFEVDDVNLPLDHYREAFNFVHMRCMAGGIHDFEAFLFRTARLIRPGGVLHIISGFTEVYGENREPYPHKNPGEPGFSPTQWLMTQYRNAQESRGNKAHYVGHNRHIWLEKNPNYTDVTTRDSFIPLGPWKPGLPQREAIVATMMREDISHVLHAFKPMLLLTGHKEDEVDLHIEAALRELRELRLPGYIKWRFNSAVKTDDGWHSQPV